MRGKYIIKFFIYVTLFGCFGLAERETGISCVSVPFLAALFFCKENLFIVLAAFSVGCGLAAFSLEGLICTMFAVAVIFGAAVLHYRIKKKIKLLEVCALAVMAQLPVIYFGIESTIEVVYTVISLVLSPLFCYVAVVGLFPLLVRGMRYKISFKESWALAVFVFALSVGLSSQKALNMEFFYMPFCCAVIILSEFDKTKLTEVGCIAGLGAAVGNVSPEYIAVCCLLCLVNSFFIRYYPYVKAIFTFLGFIVIKYFLLGGFEPLELIPPAVGCIIGGVIPIKVYEKLHAYRQSYQDKFALRTVVNRDRDDVSRKLYGVSQAFSEMQKLLTAEISGEENPFALAGEVCENCCGNCTRLGHCRKKLGDRLEPVQRLVMAALDNGKATLLDAGVVLGESCTRLSSLIGYANESVKKFRIRQDKKTGVEKGKEMVVAQIGGVSQLLNGLAQSVNSGVTFDTSLEKRLIEELGYANIIASDAVIYNNEGKPQEVTLVVRECDADKEKLSIVLNDVMCVNMTEISRCPTVKGMVSISYYIAPKYDVIYGESVISKEDISCGDTRQAVSLGHNKVMFILSDGMGTGKAAFETSSYVISLIEIFYKAGFDHKTIFTCVSNLLSLRKKEDFSALDVVISDTQSGETDFIKQGGRESYIVSDGDIRIVEAESLPLGIVENTEPTIERCRLKNNDLIIMLSDGVTDVIGKEELSLIIKDLSPNNPQKIADVLTENAQRLRGKDIDDMTAIVIRFSRK